MDELVDASGYDIPSDYLSVFCFAGLYGSCLYYANQLKNKTNKTKARDDIKKVCHLFARAIVSAVQPN